jgi:DNA-directed RNA polymerase specialized sigma24 family protein
VTASAGKPADEATARPAPAERSAEERAEEIVERVSAEATRFARRLVGRAREELEDILAEARALGRGERGQD